MAFQTREQQPRERENQDVAQPNATSASRTGPGLQHLQTLGPRPEPQTIQSLISSHPDEQTEIVNFCHQRFGNAFVGQIFHSRQRDPGERFVKEPPNAGAVDMGAPTDVDLASAATELIGQGMRNENIITNEVFWRRYPAIRDIKLTAGTKEAREWIRVRNEYVRPALEQKGDAAGTAERPAPPPARAPKAAVPEEQHAEPPPEVKAPPREEAVQTPIALPQVASPVQAEVPATVTQAAPPAPVAATNQSSQPSQSQAPTTAAPIQSMPAPEATPEANMCVDPNDAYYGQGDNSYRDKSQTGAGVVFDRGWASKKPGKKGTAGGNTCNMTSLTMALVSMSGSEEAAREKVCESLKKNGVHMGACATVNGRPVDIKKALDDPELLSQIQLEDLVIAACIGKKGGYGDVTSHAEIAKTAVEVGIADQSGGIKGDRDLSKPQVRAKVAEMIASGQRIIGSTTGHIIYLVGASDEGIVMHDPAGMRTQAGGFLHGGTVAENGKTWVGWMKNSSKRKEIMRRTKGNPQLGALFEKLAQIADNVPKKEWDDALEPVAAEHPGRIELGQGNFYSPADIKAFDAKAIVTMSAKEPATGD